MKNLFPELPQDLSTLSVEELEALRGEFQSAARDVRDQTADLSDFAGQPEAVVQQFQDGVVALRAIEDEIKGRADAEQTFVDTLSAAAEGVDLGDEVVEVTQTEITQTEATVEHSEPEDEPEDEVEVVEEPEQAVVASALPKLRLPATPKRHEAPLNLPVLAAFMASSGIPNVVEGKALDRKGLAEALTQKRKQMVSTPEGVKEKVVVASLDYGSMFPDERRLTGSPDDVEKIYAVMEAINASARGEDNMLAAGGLCAPLTPFYEVQGFGSARRPVRDALMGFNAVRGGVNVAPGISLAFIDADATGIVTAAEDAVGGTTGAKSCWAIDCPDFEETTIAAIYACLQFGNFLSRSWQELVDRLISETRAVHARLAETYLLDGISASSITKNVSQVAVYGATSSMIASIVYAAAGFRSRHRTEPDLRFRALLPEWLPDLLLMDLANQQFGRFDYSRDGITTLLRGFGIEPTFYMDGATGAGQVFGAQTDNAALLDFPNTVVTYLFPEASFLHLDGGELDLGIVRDSTLNAQNNWQLFVENFENVAAIGVEAYAITTTVCPSGTVANPATAITC